MNLIVVHPSQPKYHDAFGKDFFNLSNRAKASHDFKTKGNECFKRAEFDEAIDWYNRAMSGSDLGAADISILYANRAICQLKKGEYAAAIASCVLATDLDDSNEKAWFRRMLAYIELNDDSNVLMAARKVVALNPRNEVAYRTVDGLAKQLVDEAEGELVLM